MGLFKDKPAAKRIQFSGIDHLWLSLTFIFKVRLHGEKEVLLFHQRRVMLWIPTLQLTVEVKACCPSVQQKCCLWHPRSGYVF